MELNNNISSARRDFQSSANRDSEDAERIRDELLASLQAGGNTDGNRNLPADSVLKSFASNLHELTTLVEALQKGTPSRPAVPIPPEPPATYYPTAFSTSSTQRPGAITPRENWVGQAPPNFTQIEDTSRTGPGRPEAMAYSHRSYGPR